MLPVDQTTTFHLCSLAGNSNPVCGNQEFGETGAYERDTTIELLCLGPTGAIVGTARPDLGPTSL